MPKQRWNRGSGRRRLCEWFAMCPYGAVGFVMHPVLDQVDVCERCGKLSGRKVHYFHEG